MEKISGIVPASARVKSVNLREGQPVRPGAPPFGRPMGSSALAEAKAKTTAEKAMDEHNKLMQIRSGDKPGPEIITEMADRFFMQRTTGPGEQIQDVDVNYQMDRPLEPEDSEVRFLSDSIDPVSDDMEMEDYTPPGTYLDVKV